METLFTIFDYEIIYFDFSDEKPLLKLLFWSNMFIGDWAQLFSLFLNMCLCIDLVLTIWYPFSVAKNRTKYYMTTSFIISMVLTIAVFEI